MYDSSLKYKWDNKNVLDTAVQEGFEKGIEQGIEKGERKRTLELAREFKKLGISSKDIAKGTGLSIEEIEKL
jgi:predicted transposase/invertase (TIGR01784 family)